LAKKSPGKAKSVIKVDPDLKMIQDKLSDQINLSVEIKQKRRGGEICIKFSQFDELDSLFKRLGIE
jgi:ParB family chromosome partitioning protein